MALPIPSIGARVACVNSCISCLAAPSRQRLHAIPLLRHLSYGQEQQGAVSSKLPALCTKALEKRKLPFNVRKRSGDFNPGANAIQVMTMKVSKGLEFPVVALPGVGHMPAVGEDETEAARVFYVAVTRATQRLVMGVGVKGQLGMRLSE